MSLAARDLAPAVRLLIAAGLTGASLFAGACGQKTSVQTTEAALTSYETGRYSEAKQAAENRYREARGSEQETAALTAGLAAFNMNQYGEAERWLAPLVSSADPEISGKAGATMGLIHQKRGQNGAAAQFLVDAADKLEGDEQVKTRLAAARAYEAVGQPGLAQEQYVKARTTRTTPVSTTMTMGSSSSSGFADSEVCTPGTICTTCTVVGWPTPGAPQQTGSSAVVSAKGYTVQMGAFSTKTNADKRASQIRPATAKAGLGLPRVVPGTDKAGRSLYMVQVGDFQNKAAATDARRRLGNEGVVAAVR